MRFVWDVCEKNFIAAENFFHNLSMQHFFNDDIPI